MKNTIFYSWQSDLPNNTNRGFIESCLEKVLKNIKSISPFSLELSIDRDTKQETGTPDILDSIYTKIQKTKIFVADISIINPDYPKRKCPNPNVLLELGYASRILGWDKIFCIYNLDFGTIDDLPFDIRQRRPILYSLSGSNKTKIRENISNIITTSIIKLHSTGGLFNVIDDYVKEKVDTEILTICNHLSTIILGYSDKNILERTSILLNLENIEIEDLLLKSKFMGFQIYKHLGVHEMKLREIADKSISSVHQSKELAAPIIELISWIGRFDALNSSRNDPDFYIPLGTTSNEYTPIHGLSLNSSQNDLPNRYVLLKRLDQNKQIVLDFGDFIEKTKIEVLICNFSFNKDHIKMYVLLFRQFIEAVQKWLNLTNGTFILDTFHNFEMKTKINM